MSRARETSILEYNQHSHQSFLRRIENLRINQSSKEQLTGLYNNAVEIFSSYFYSEEVFNIFIEALRTNFSLNSLTIHPRMLPVLEVNRKLSQALQYHQNLKILDLSTNDIDEDCIIYIADILLHNQSITSLNLCANNIGDRGIILLSNAISQNLNLQNLRIDFNNISHIGTSTLSEALRINTSLKNINLAINNIGNEGVIALSDVMKTNKSFEILNLGRNKIGNEGVRNLSIPIKENYPLKTLLLENNEWNIEGTRFLSIAIANNSYIQYLDLSGNNLRNTSLVILSQSIQQHSSLSRLELSGNSIGEEGIVALSRALLVNKSLKFIDLSNNNIDHKAAKHLATAIQANSYLEQLFLAFNIIKDLGAYEIANALKENNTLIKLDISINHISERGEHAIARALKDNYSIICTGLEINTPPGLKPSALEEYIIRNIQVHKLFNTLYHHFIFSNEIIAPATGTLEHKYLVALVNAFANGTNFLFTTEYDNRYFEEFRYQIFNKYFLQTKAISNQKIEDIQLSLMDNYSIEAPESTDDVQYYRSSTNTHRGILFLPSDIVFKIMEYVGSDINLEEENPCSLNTTQDLADPYQDNQSNSFLTTITGITTVPVLSNRSDIDNYTIATSHPSLADDIENLENSTSSYQENNDSNFGQTMEEDILDFLGEC